MKRLFHFLNKLFMVPMFRLGFGPIFGNPLWGYIMVLKTVGRKTGKLRYAPVNYAIIEGNVYCLSGWGQASDWYRNLKAHPALDVILPGGAIRGMAEEVADPAMRRVAIRQILKNGGFAGFMEGFNPYHVADEELERQTVAMTLVRIRPVGIGSGASDPAGWAWVWMPVSIVLLVLILHLVLR